MADLDKLVKLYRRHIQIPWPSGVAFEQRVILLVYEPKEERFVRTKVEAFANETREAKHAWATVDVSRTLAEWMANQEYRDSYFEDPEALTPGLRQAFADFVSERVIARLSDSLVNEDTVVALIGTGALYGFMRVSNLITRVAPAVKGRLLIFFPGEKEGPVYRLLGGQDGFNYHAVPISTNTAELE
jgi:hypothetical protein